MAALSEFRPPARQFMPHSSKRKKPARKPSKALEKAARLIKDADDFVEHVGNLSERYRREHALDAGPRGRTVKQSLAAFRKRATALADWLQQARKEAPATPERDALDKISVELHGAPGLAQAQSQDVQSWLARAGKAADVSVAKAKLQPRVAKSALRTAPRVAAEGLRATFEHHQLKFSTQLSKARQSDAIRLLCAIAKHAGDADLTPQLARQALLESGSR